MNPAEHANRYDWQNAIMGTDFPPTTKYVLLALSCFMDPQGERGFPSTKMLAESAGLSERCVITHLKAGKKAGLFVIVKHRIKGKDWARHEYIPILPKGYQAKSDSTTPKNGTPYTRYGTEPRSAPSKNLTSEKNEGTEPRSAPSKNLTSEKNEGTEPRSVPSKNLTSEKNEGTEPRSVPSKNLTSEKNEGTEPRSVPNEGGAKTGEGTEPRSAARGYGTEPDDTMALNDVQSSNTSYLKTTTPKPPPTESAPEETGGLGGRCGGGEIDKNSKDVTQENPFGEEKPAGPPALVWPVQFGESEKRAAEKTLKPFAPDQAQDLLDELAAQLMIKAINKPLAYLRTLAKKAKAGEFELEAGIPFRDSREARRKRDEAIARRDREEKVRIAQPQEPKAAPPSKPGMKVISERISDMRQALTGRRF